MRLPDLRCLLVLAAAAVLTSSAAAGDRYALVIGVRQYDRNQLRSLPYAESDAVAISEKLKSLGFRRVVLMTQTLGAKESRFLPTARNVRETIEGFLNPRTWNEDDTAVIVLSGHGVQFKGDRVSYFCPMDAELERKESLVAIDDIYRKLEKCPAAFRLLIADCCRNDPQSDFSRSRSTVDLESVTRPQRLKPPGGVAAFFSCSEGEKAFESPSLKRGIFTHYLLDALSSPASDLDGDGRLDLDELVRFTKRNVTDYVKTEFGEKTIQVPELVGKTRGLVPIAEFPREPAFAGTKAGQEWDGNGLRMRLCWCPDGSFTMGSPKTENGREGGEEQVPVTLTGFWLGKYEVTQSEWSRVMRTTVEQQKEKSGSSYLYGTGAEFPMYYVNHDEATEFCRKLTQQERAAGRLPAGWEYRLPTEAQWEYGCRAGTTTATAFGDKLSSKQANIDGRSPYNGAEPGAYLNSTREVGRYAGNAWGLHDMHGNVREWCRDWFVGRLLGGHNPEGVEPAINRRLRGGSFGGEGDDSRSAYRGSTTPDRRYAHLGFRVAAVRVSP